MLAAVAKCSADAKAASRLTLGRGSRTRRRTLLPAPVGFSVDASCRRDLRRRLSSEFRGLVGPHFQTGRCALDGSTSRPSRRRRRKFGVCCLTPG